MNLSKQQNNLFKKTMEEARSQLEKMDETMEEVLDETRLRLQELQESKKMLRQIYESSAVLLGINAEPVETEAEIRDVRISKTNLLENSR